MKDSATAFVDLRRISITKSSASFWQKISGRPTESHILLKDITLKLAPGDKLTVFGKSASGKSSLLRLLTGSLLPSQGAVQINGQSPSTQTNLAVGYISQDTLPPTKDTVYDVLHGFASSHQLDHIPAKISEVAEAFQLQPILNRPAVSLSTTESLNLKLAKALLSDTPLILLDDVADDLGPDTVLHYLANIFTNHIVLVATRNTATADHLGLPLIIMHAGQILHAGTKDSIASQSNCSSCLDVWVEGVRYDLFRTLKKHKGISSVTLEPTTQYSGQKLRLNLKSSRYLPAIYDLLVQAPLIRVEEISPSMSELVSQISPDRN